MKKKPKKKQLKKATKHKWRKESIIPIAQCITYDGQIYIIQDVINVETELTTTIHIKAVKYKAIS